jgi:hypothetical protein
MLGFAVAQPNLHFLNRQVLTPNPSPQARLRCTHKSENSRLCHNTPPLAPPRKRGGELDLQLNSVFRAENLLWARMCVHGSFPKGDLQVLDTTKYPPIAFYKLGFHIHIGNLI